MGLYDTYLSQKSSTTVATPSTGGSLYSKFLAIQQPSIVPTPEPTFFSKAKDLVIGTINQKLPGVIPGVVSGYQSAVATAPQKSFNPKKASDVLTSSVASAFGDAGKRLDTFTSTFNDHHTSLLQKGVNAGEAGVGAINAAFSLAMAPLTYATAYPGVGHVADKVNELFSAVGGGASGFATEAYVQNIPFISQETKDIIKPLVGEIAALSSQIILGKVGGDVVGKIQEKSKQVVSTIEKDVAKQPSGIEIPNKGTGLYEKFKSEQKTDVPTAVTKPTETAPTDLSNLTFYHGADATTAGKIAKTGFQPTSKFPGSGAVDLTSKEAATSFAGETGKVIPVKVNAKDILTFNSLADYTKALDQKTGLTGAEAEKAVMGSHDAIYINNNGTPLVFVKDPKSIQPVGETQSGVAKRVEALAVEQGLTKSGYDQLATYEKTSNKDAAQALADLRNSGMDNYRAVLRNEKPLPEGVKAGALVADAYNYLKENPKAPHSADLAYELANSVHTGVFSEAGSTLQSGRGIADTPAGKFEAIKKAKEARAGEKAVKKAKSLPKEAKKAMDEVNLSKEDLGKLESFINKITC